jgi:shikimate dehydrogenase
VPARVLVNVTSLGMHGEDLPAEVGLSGFEPELVADVVYADESTALCRWGEQHGARVVAGLEMLLRQGARSFERWTGQPAPLEAMRAALR